MFNIICYHCKVGLQLRTSNIKNVKHDIYTCFNTKCKLYADIVLHLFNNELIKYFYIISINNKFYYVIGDKDRNYTDLCEHHFGIGSIHLSPKFISVEDNNFNDLHKILVNYVSKILKIRSFI